MGAGGRVIMGGPRVRVCCVVFHPISSRSHHLVRCVWGEVSHHIRCVCVGGGGGSSYQVCVCVGGGESSYQVCGGVSHHTSGVCVCV